MCIFHDYVQDLVVQVHIVSPMAKPCIVSCVAFDLCALRAYAQTVAMFPGLPSFQLLLDLSKSIHCSLHGRLHVVG